MSSVPVRRRPGFLAGAALAGCLFAFVLGARWAMLDRFGTDLPVWDQWDAEGVHLLAPWYAGHLTLAELFLPHNEHRVVLTKLLNLGVTLANRGQWDQRLECAVNAFLPALIAVALFLFGRRLLRGAWQTPLFLVLAVSYGLPLAWQNFLGGFHSQQLFLVGLSLGAIGWLTDAPAWSVRWCLGSISLILAMVSMASGCFAAVVVVVFLTLRAFRGEVSWRSAAPTLVLGAGLAALGWLTRVFVFYHQALKAHTLREFGLTVLYSFQWPTTLGHIRASLLLALVLWLPWCWLVWRILRGAAGGDRRRGWIVAGLGAWVILQILATGYARGAGAPTPASRYIDTLILGAVANALAWGWLRQSGAGRLPVAALGLAWIAVFGIGACLQLQRIFTVELPPEITEDYYEKQNMRNYLATGDEAYLHHLEIPYPEVTALIARLNLPGLRAAMPASVRLPLALAPAGPPGVFSCLDSRAPQRPADAPPPAPPGPGSGLSPSTAPLTNRVTWGSYGARGPGEWKSKAVRASLGGWLRFDVAGQIGEPGVGLELRDAATQERLAVVGLGRVPGDSWHAAFVRAPARDFVVVAHASDPRRWLAFGEPVEMGTLSYWAWRATRHGLLLAEIAAAAALLIGLAACPLGKLNHG